MGFFGAVAVGVLSGDPVGERSACQRPYVLVVDRSLAHHRMIRRISAGAFPRGTNRRTGTVRSAGIATCKVNLGTKVASFSPVRANDSEFQI